MKKLIFSAIVAVTFFACKKEQMTPVSAAGNSGALLENNSESNAHDKVGEVFLHDTSLINEYVEPEYLEFNQLKPSTVGVQNKNGILFFETMKDFKEVIKTLVNQREDDLDIWEASLNFHSLRSFYNDMELDENVDDYELEQQRIQDKAFETVLNKNYQVLIGDSLYELDLTAGKLYIYNPVTLQKKGELDIDKSYCENSPRSTNAHRYFSSSEKVVGDKWNSSYGLYITMGAKTTYYEKNWRGKWKKKKASTIYLFLDQWYHLRWRYSYEWPGTERDISNKISWSQNAKSVSRTFKWDGGLPTYVYCVPEYGRIHHWTTNFNVDAHTTPW